MASYSQEDRSSGRLAGLLGGFVMQWPVLWHYAAAKVLCCSGFDSQGVECDMLAGHVQQGPVQRQHAPNGAFPLLPLLAWCAGLMSPT